MQLMGVSFETMRPIQRTSFQRHRVGAYVLTPRRPRAVFYFRPDGAAYGKPGGLAFNNAAGFRLEMEKFMKSALEEQVKSALKGQKADLEAQKAKTKLLETELAAQKAKTRLLETDSAVQKAKLTVLSVDKVANAASQLANILIYAADVKLHAVGNAALKPQAPMRARSVAKFKGRTRSLQKANLAVPWASLAKGDLAAFNRKSDEMIVFRWVMA